MGTSILHIAFTKYFYFKLYKLGHTESQNLLQLQYCKMKFTIFCIILFIYSISADPAEECAALKIPSGGYEGICQGTDKYQLCVNTNSNGTNKLEDELFNCPAGVPCKSGVTHPCPDSAAAASADANSRQKGPLAHILGEIVVPMKKRTPCGKHRFICVTPQKFLMCHHHKGKNEAHSALQYKCPVDTHCKSSKYYPCVLNREDEPIPAVTESPPVLPPTCTAAGKFPASQCNQYHECEQSNSTWKSVLKTCAEGHAFDSIEKKDCRFAEETDCITAVVVQPPVPSFPKCTGERNFSAPQCNDFYECEGTTHWWRPNLRTCPVGEAFNVKAGHCDAAAGANCAFSTLIKREPKISPPLCNGPSNSTASQCNHYYECAAMFFWWTPVLKMCPLGQGYDPKTRHCRDSDKINCIYAKLTKEVHHPPPKCEEAGRWTANQCNQYYECQSSLIWFWTPILETCPHGMAYDRRSQECVDGRHANCDIAIKEKYGAQGIPEKCTEKGKFPLSVDNVKCFTKYYECSGEKSLEMKIISCPDNHVFDPKIDECTTTPSHICT